MVIPVCFSLTFLSASYSGGSFSGGTEDDESFEPASIWLSYGFRSFEAAEAVVLQASALAWDFETFIGRMWSPLGWNLVPVWGDEDAGLSSSREKNKGI